MSQNTWMVRAGEKGVYFDDFKSKGLIAIGWNLVGDLKNVKTRGEIKKKLEKEYDETGVKAGLSAGILFRFSKEFSEGDTVLTYDPINRYYLIGEIITDYYYNDKGDDFFHKRNVKWLNRISRDNLSKKTRNALGSVLTIFELKEEDAIELNAYKDNDDVKLKASLFRSNIHKKKSELYSDFEGNCAYCKRHLDDPNDGTVENFYPKSAYPELAFDEDNLLFVCNTCNIAKSNKFPIDSNGYPLLMNPRTDIWEENIKLNSDGTLEAITEKGQLTIDLLKLNRDSLVEARSNKILEEQFNDSITRVSPDYYDNFKTSLESIRQLNVMSGVIRGDLQYPQFTMLFSNAITILETYLSDALITQIKGDREILIQFVETFKDFEDINISLNKLFEVFNDIDKRVTNALAGLMYHNLPKLKGIYESTLGIAFPDISYLAKAVNKRHHFVHRSGKDKDGNLQSVDQSEVNDLCNKIEEFVEIIEGQLKSA